MRLILPRVVCIHLAQCPAGDGRGMGEMKSRSWMELLLLLCSLGQRLLLLSCPSPGQCPAGAGGWVGGPILPPGGAVPPKPGRDGFVCCLWITPCDLSESLCLHFLLPSCSSSTQRHGESSNPALSSGALKRPLTALPSLFKGNKLLQLIAGTAVLLPPRDSPVHQE